MRKCHDVKMCSYSAEELNSSHVSVNFETNVYRNIYNTYEHSIEKYTLNLMRVMQQNILLDLFQNYNVTSVSEVNDIEDSTSNRVLDKYYTVLPYNSKTFPYRISGDIVIDGIHMHPSPPPVKIPINLVEDLQSIMNNKDLLNLTARKFLTKPMLLTYLNSCSLNSIYPSLNNQSKINYLIAKEKRSINPHGQNIFGAMYKFMKNKDLKDTYIRKIEYFHNRQILIRIQGEIKEWELVAYIKNLQKTLIFARVFTNNESADAYQNMFAAVFSIVKEDTNSEICFNYINGKGIACILADAYPGQAPRTIFK
ncbi:hypothetical protein C1646_749981 [Rhizophagus diaphanus]|nr:hypothetical protein C1646_749981 [Rhizophagus diaphanus] [Rhizophagus sp. MUCL 43196]